MAGSVLLIMAFVGGGCTGTPAVERSAVPPLATVSPSLSTPAGPSPATALGGCGQTSVLVGGLPQWAQSSLDDLPYVMSREGNLIGVLFSHPLRASSGSETPGNKILWRVREPRNGADLRLTLRHVGGHTDPVIITRTADSGPGEIYPSVVDVPATGCWAVVAEWDGHRATLELAYT